MSRHLIPRGKRRSQDDDDDEDVLILLAEVNTLCERYELLTSARTEKICRRSRRMIVLCISAYGLNCVCRGVYRIMLTAYVFKVIVHIGIFSETFKLYEENDYYAEVDCNA